MSVLPIYVYGTKILKKRSQNVTETNESLHKLIFDMFETMRKANGIGLAANQVGDSRRIITIDISDADEPNAEGEAESNEHPTSPDLPRTLVVINPEIIATEGSWIMEEGCLSIPDIHAEVERPEKIKVRFLDAELHEQELVADGLLARVLQHEMDHLEGVLFIERISRAKRSMLMPKLRKIRKGEIDLSYNIVTMMDE
ncbi:MAG TPA: peptide deformylase [Bacteroidota bacterium]|jgi:peptide deformylase|nr:peptide deformylase [Bacteroidota bacterium]